jgi:hypothetical protein
MFRLKDITMISGFRPMLTRSELLWDIMQRRWVIVDRRFGTTYQSLLQGSRRTLKMEPIRCPETSVKDCVTSQKRAGLKLSPSCTHLCSPSLFYLLVHSRCRGFLWFHLITLRHAPQSVGVLWTRDRPVAETSTWQHKHSQQTNIHAAGGIRTRNPSKRSAADLRLRPRGHWDRRTHLYTHKMYNCVRNMLLKWDGLMSAQMFSWNWVLNNAELCLTAIYLTPHIKCNWMKHIQPVHYNLRPRYARFTTNWT